MRGEAVSARFVSILMRPLLFLFLASVAAPGQNLTFRTMPDKTVLDRLARISPDPKQRADNLYSLFEAAGCVSPHLSREEIKGARAPNVTCTLTGATEQTIVVGAHHDHVPKGEGAVDNWSGASLLPSLYQTLVASPHRFTYVFVGFADEGRGLVGSRSYVKRLGKDGLKMVRAMVNVDSVGLSPTKVWVSRSDKRLVNYLARIAAALRAPVAGIDVEQVGDSDSRPFKEKRIPVLDIHSVTQATLSLLHSPDDTLSAVNSEHYLETFKLLAALLAYVDQEWDNDRSSPAGRTWGNRRGPSF